MKSSNPVLGGLVNDAQRGRIGQTSAGYAPNYPSQGYGAPSYPQPYPEAAGRTMTLDDVVIRTIALLTLTGVAGAFSWVFLPSDSPVTGIMMIGSMLGGLVLGLVIAFKRITNPYLIGGYAVLQGLMLGVVSRYFESYYSGIVIQAVVATFGVFGGMAVLYKLGILRNSPKFTKWVLGALIGCVGLMFINFIMNIFGGSLGIRDNNMTGNVGWLPIVFSLVVIGVAALTFIIDFDMIEQGVRAGLPEKFAWYCAFGLLVGLIFLYWEILRLLGYLRR